MPSDEQFYHEVRALTVGELRAALDGMPDETPVAVFVAEEPGGGTCDTQVIYHVGREDDGTLGISCEFPAGHYYRRREV